MTSLVAEAIISQTPPPERTDADHAILTGSFALDLVIGAVALRYLVRRLRSGGADDG